ncbi:unnamed protein product [Cuscuta epithymum]|uniref:DOMON domain-containing protein n=1 Tax=Cuscuta epithymum TaxID=186058 RepID=A0AAV0FEA5_9ASTE|nr:unnamed protein product [Cuscuta epithymum]
MSPSSLLLLIGAILISPALSLNCASKIDNVYANCTVLPSLGAVLHWNYTETNSTLSFAAGANISRGMWFGWGINPGNGDGMNGAFAFLALYPQSGILTVKPYSLTLNSRSTITEVPNKSLPWIVQNSSAVVGSAGGVWIYATLSNLTRPSQLNTLWQVGPLSTDRQPHPLGHQMETENMNAKVALTLAAGNSVAPGVSPSPAPAGDSGITPAQSPGNATGSSSASWKSTANLYPLLLVFGIFGLVL